MILYFMLIGAFAIVAIGAFIYGVGWISNKTGISFLGKKNDLSNNIEIFLFKGLLNIAFSAFFCLGIFSLGLVCHAFGNYLVEVVTKFLQ